ncbi:MAG: DUF2851 family protein [Opitutaceae bacterium]|nr:DUF2851 family protein [Opitutaceae bacterium]
MLQKIWLQGEFDRSRAVTEDGRAVEVLSPGRWNLLGGPDFTGAHLRLDGRTVSGAVEVHFHAGDWAAHGHQQDSAYANVVLHVVLFPPGPRDQPARTADGAVIPVLVMMPLLLRDLEEYASDDALENLTARGELRSIEALARLGSADRHSLLIRMSEQRWRQKIGFARARIARLGWTEAAHHAALEILGYRFNRVPMLALASRHALAKWADDIVSPRALFESEGREWRLQGVRPPNHPLARLRQYKTWVKACPNWPDRLRSMSVEVPVAAAAAVPASTRQVRTVWRLRQLRERMAGVLCAGAIGGTRLDNLICDGFLPLLAAEGERDLSAVWFHWFPGDQPAQIQGALRALEETNRQQPLCHGLAQGFIGWRLSQETGATN